MKVKKQTIVKIDKVSYELYVGSVVPQVVIDFWKSSGQINGLKKDGIIDDSDEDKGKNKKNDVEGDSGTVRSNQD
jgi:hypothetical protein